jgi:hypothetical protein
VATTPLETDKISSAVTDAEVKTILTNCDGVTFTAIKEGDTLKTVKESIFAAAKVINWVRVNENCLTESNISIPAGGKIYKYDFDTIKIADRFKKCIAQGCSKN